MGLSLMAAHCWLSTAFTPSSAVFEHQGIAFVSLRPHLPLWIRHAEASFVACTQGREFGLTFCTCCLEILIVFNRERILILCGGPAHNVANPALSSSETY